MSTDPRRRPMPPPPPPPPPAEEASLETATTQGQQPPQPQEQEQQRQQHGHPEPQKQRIPQQQNDDGFKLKFCTVCASNNNRSMEAHLQLTRPTHPVIYPTLSFGTGSLVRLPGPSISQPNVYHFNTTSYAAMFHELQTKDQRLYRGNGILNMLERNKNVKWGPERWQDWRVGVPRVGKRWHGGRSAAATAQLQQHYDANSQAQQQQQQQQEDGEDVDYSQDQGSAGMEAGAVDVVITCEERCWDAVVDDLLSRGAPLNRPVHVFNVDIKDNHEEALVGGRAIRDLADSLNAVAREEREAWTVHGGSGGDGTAAGLNGFDMGHGVARQGFDERVPDVLAEWQERWPHLPALWTLAWL